MYRACGNIALDVVVFHGSCPQGNTARVAVEGVGLPYRSAKQRTYMHVRHPRIAARWDAEYGGKVKRKPKQRKRKER